MYILRALRCLNIFKLKHKAPPVRYPEYMLSNTRDDFEAFNTYVINICATINEWNMYTTLANELYVHEIFISPQMSVSDGTHSGTKDAFHLTAMLCYSLGNLYGVTGDHRYRKWYIGLLDGIDRCIITSDNTYAIRTHPLNHKYGYCRVVSTDILTALVLLISGFGRFTDNHIEDLEFAITTKFLAVMQHHDFRYMDCYGDTALIDLHPNIKMSPVKIMLYIAIQALACNRKGMFSPLLFEILSSRPVYPIYSDTSLANVFRLCVLLLEAIFNAYTPTDGSSDRFYKSKKAYCKLAIGWIEHHIAYVGNCNPEVDGVLLSMYEYLGNDDMVTSCSHRVQSVINILYDHHVYRKTESARLRLGRYYADKLVTKHELPLPPLYRTNQLYWWSDPSPVIGPSEYEYPVFEYVIAYSRIAHLGIA